MDIQEINDKVKNDEYAVDVPYKNNRDEYKEKAREKQEQFKEDLIEALVEDYDITYSMAEKIYEYAFETGHANGYYEIVIYASEYAELVEACLKMQ